MYPSEIKLKKENVLTSENEKKTQLYVKRDSHLDSNIP